MGSELAGKRILLIEDDFMIAGGLTDVLESAGAEVIGPFGWLDEAMGAAATVARIDAAITDINLHGELSYPAVEILLARGIRVVFMTGYGREIIQPEYAAFPACLKPFNRADVIQALVV